MNKKLYLPVCICAGFMLLTNLLAAQQETTKATAPKPEFQLETLYLAIMKKAAGYDESRAQAAKDQHRAYWQQVADKGHLILAGPVLDSSMDAVVIFRAQSKDEAITVAGNDPLAKQGLWTASVHPWGTQKDFLKPIKSLDFANTYYLGFLKRGDKWSPEETPERQRIQEAHLKNIGRLHEIGKLVAAGPFMEDTDLRGIFVFKTATAEEANELTNTDPAVQARRLKIELHSWKLPASVFSKP
jgi:uncharacterized protein YciI